MVFNEIQFALFIEVIVAGLVGLGIVIFLYIRLRRRYRVIAEKTTPAAQHASLREYLQQEKTHTQQEQKRIGTDPESTKRLLAWRQVFLTLEASVVEFAQANRLNFWPTYTKTAESQPLLVEWLHEKTAALEESSASVQQLKAEADQVPLLLERITNLEKFKSLFFEIKGQLDQANQIIDILNAEMQHYLTDQAKQDEYNALISKLRSENSQLNQQVSLAEKEYEILMSNYASIDAISSINAERVDRLVADMPEQTIIQLIEQAASMSTNMGSLRQVAEEQQHSIVDLAKAHESLNVGADRSRELQGLVGSLTEQNRNMQNVIGILEGENQFLQKQLNESNTTEKITASAKEDVDKLAQLLEEKTAEYNRLYGKYVAMEKEYLANFAELNRLKESKSA